ncbi:hypothetical protein NPIL_665781 [Nephila pilipes]|uniref:Uncharacterized protein n=1 Tax=Nephila pilipes TaxID=299642 RepID=A0A8X6TXP2_NEPPI|nr:hypothetical protein NPIL_665781 [Nephila pilipes]
MPVHCMAVTADSFLHAEIPDVNTLRGNLRRCSRRKLVCEGLDACLRNWSDGGESTLETGWREPGKDWRARERELSCARGTFQQNCAPPVRGEKEWNILGVFLIGS